MQLCVKRVSRCGIIKIIKNILFFSNDYLEETRDVGQNTLK
jgi:hypothetical protein